MTNNQHGQVPEALRLAEEISNLVCSSEAAAKIAAAADELCRLAKLEAQIEALSGVQALSAAPVEQEEAAQRLRKTLDIDPGDVNDPLHPRYIAGFKSGHAAGRRRAAPKAAPVTQQAGYAEVIECGNSYAKVKLKGEAFGSARVGDIFYTAPTSPAFVYAGERGSDLEGLLDGYDHGTAFYAAPQPSPAAQGDAIEHELAMLIRRIVSSARRNCEDGSNVLKLANEAWAYLVRKGLNGSPLRDAGIESDPTPPAKAAESVQEDAARLKVAVDLLEELAEHDSYSTEYDGRMVSICPECGEQEGEHRPNCAFVRAKAYLAAREQGGA